MMSLSHAKRILFHQNGLDTFIVAWFHQFDHSEQIQEIKIYSHSLFILVYSSLESFFL